MSDELSKTAPQIISSLAKDIYQDVAHPPLKTLGEALDGIFKAISHYPRYWGIMSDISLDQKQEKFEARMRDKVSAIPEEKRVLPKPNILGPSIQALEYGIFEDHLSEMFVNLLTGAMNSDIADSIHPSFVEIIKQINSDEAKVLKRLYEIRGMYPLASVITQVSDQGGYRTLLDKYFLLPYELECSAPDRYAEIIENLDRLKLIEYSVSQMGSTISVSEVYDPLRQNIKEVRKINLDGDADIGKKKVTGGAYFVKGFVKISGFGVQFANVCIK